MPNDVLIPRQNLTIFDEAGKGYKLIDRHRWFCDLYRGECRFNAIDAYERVYPKAAKKSIASNAYRLLEKPVVQLYLVMCSAEAARKADISEAKILEDLSALKEMAMGREKMPIAQFNKDGVLMEADVFKYDGNTAKNALELMGKYYENRMWVERTEHEGAQSVSFNFDLTGKDPDRHGKKQRLIEQAEKQDTGPD